MAEYEEQVAARLKAVMAAFGIPSNPELADLGDSTKSAVNNWLLGYNLPRVPEMSRLCERTGITLDWLYRGTIVSMDPKLLMTLAGFLRAFSDWGYWGQAIPRLRSSVLFA